jgi:hypothetical protein
MKRRGKAEVMGEKSVPVSAFHHKSDWIAHGLNCGFMCFYTVFLSMARHPYMGTPQSVGLLWMRDQLVAETST